MPTHPKNNRHVDLELLEDFRNQPCVVCGREGPSDPAHIKTRGSRGDDYDWNLYSACRQHHREQGSKGWGWMFRKYPSFRTYIRGKGWEIVDMKFGLVKLLHPLAKY